MQGGNPHISKKSIHQRFDYSKSLVLIVISLAVGSTSTILSNMISADISTLISDVIFIVVPLFFAILSTLLLKRHGIKTREGKLVLLFALFAILRCIAEIIWIYIEQVVGIDPYPSIADLFWLMGNTCMIVFLLYHLNLLKRFITKKSKIAIISIALVYSCMPLVLLVPASDIFDEFAISFLYTIMDGIMISLIFSILISINDVNKNKFLVLLLAGITSISFSDILFTTIPSEYATGNPIDFGWIFGYIFLVFSTRHYSSIKEINKLGNKLGVELIMTSNKLETTLKIVVPFITATILLTMALLYYYIVQNTYARVEPIIIGIVFVSFAAMVYFLSKNLMRFTKLRTEDLQKQRDLLEFEIKEKTSLLIKQERLAAIGQLAARFGHDIRNPLHTLQLTMFLMKQKMGPDLDPKTKEYFSRIDDSILRITHQVDSVLDFVRVKPLLASQCNLKDIILSATKKIHIPQSIRLDLPQNNALIECDAKKLEIVFINLITNAIQSMKDIGEITLKISEKSNMVHILVQDTGSGIPIEIQDKLFEPLVTTKYTGSGLGLVSCKTIIEQHGGTIILAENNHPTTFKISLPKYQPLEHNKTDMEGIGGGNQNV